MACIESVTLHIRSTERSLWYVCLKELDRIEAMRVAAEQRVQQGANDLQSQEALKSLVVTQLQTAHQKEIERFKERDFDAQNTIAQKNSELVVLRAELQILRERLRVAKQALDLLHQVRRATQCVVLTRTHHVSVHREGSAATLFSDVFVVFLSWFVFFLHVHACVGLFVPCV